MKKLIVTADDFGLCHEVNEAVIQAHTKGILTCTSLMMNESGTEEAIELAKQNPTLKIGLHLVLVEGHSVLSKEKIPDLVDEKQKFSNKVVASSFRYFFSKKLEQQIADECEAQIRKFLDAGLTIDHLNSHNHLHIHPTILDIVVKLAKKYKIHAIRVPWQGWRSLKPNQALMAIAMAPWVGKMRHKLRTAKIAFNDEVFGLFETGAMIEEAWTKAISKIKKGVTEIYCHPALQTTGILKETMPNYRHKEELAALLSPNLLKQIRAEKIERISFGDLK